MPVAAHGIPQELLIIAEPVAERTAAAGADSATAGSLAVHRRHRSRSRLVEYLILFRVLQSSVFLSGCSPVLWALWVLTGFDCERVFIRLGFLHLLDFVRLRRHNRMRIVGDGIDTAFFGRKRDLTHRRDGDGAAAQRIWIAEMFRCAANEGER